MKERIGYIDSLKGLAILLMVMGHVIAWQFSCWAAIRHAGPLDATFLFRFIYSFHMPLLMFCSGLFVIRGVKMSLKDVGVSIWKRVKSLLLPYVLTGSLLWLYQGEFGYWFLWMLFQFIVVTLMLHYICGYIPNVGQHVFAILLCVLSVAILFIVPKLMPYQKFPLLDIEDWRLYIFFSMGVLCSQYNLIERVLSKNWIYTIALVGFGFLTYWITIKGYHIPKQSVTGCVLPISAIMVLVYLFKEGYAGTSWVEQRLQYLGKHSLEVYVLHLFFLFPMYRVGEYVLDHVNTRGSWSLIFFIQLTSSLLISVIIIWLCYLVMNVVNKSSVLSLLLLGRKSEINGK